MQGLRPYPSEMKKIFGCDQTKSHPKNSFGSTGLGKIKNFIFIFEKMMKNKNENFFSNQKGTAKFSFPYGTGEALAFSP